MGNCKRRAGIATLATLVYGYPAGSADGFERFVAAMRPHRHAVDRWARFKVYRLYRGSPAWLEPAAHGIRSVAAPPAGLDLARHVAFETETGLDSREFHAAASAALAEFRRDERDFPATPLLSDDAWLGPQAAALRPTAPAASDRVRTIAGDGLDATPFPFAALEKAFGAYVPGPGRPLPEVSLAAGPPERVGRTADATRVVPVGAGLLKLLDVCATAATAGELVPRLAAAARTDGAALVGKLQALGLLRLEGAAA